MARIKNWSKFQHFKNRRPPWIKLYRDLLDDKEWHKLPPESAKILISLWLLASESENGSIPDISTISFRLRLPEDKIKRAISTLYPWLCHDDISVISPRYQDDPLETETETETELEKEGEIELDQNSSITNDFEEWWRVYPRHVSKGHALKSYTAIRKRGVTAEALLAGANQYRSDPNREPKYTKHPTTWLNAECWLDEPATGAPPKSRTMQAIDDLQRRFINEPNA